MLFYILLIWLVFTIPAYGLTYNALYFEEIPIRKKVSFLIASIGPFGCLAIIITQWILNEPIRIKFK